MDDIQAPPIGTEGTVRGVDDIGSVISFCQEILQVILGDKDLRVLDNVPQFVVKNLQGRSCTLDVKCSLGDANLISLCPICHHKIHLGLRDDRRCMVDELYEKRKERLVNCGFILGKEEFEDIILSD